MNKAKSFAIVFLLGLPFIAAAAESRPLTLYVRKSIYVMKSAHQVQIDLKMADFQRKYPNQLEEYSRISEVLAPLENVAKSNLSKDEQAQVTSLVSRKHSLEDLIGPEYSVLNREIQELTMQRDLLFAKSVQGILDKLNAGKVKVEGVKIAPESWYYLSPKVDITDLVMDEANSKSWGRRFMPDNEKLDRVFYVSQKRVFDKFRDSNKNSKELLMEFFGACSKAAGQVGADVVVDESQSGFDFLEVSLDLTDDVTTEMLRQVARR